jgi:hypothetical protein
MAVTFSFLPFLHTRNSSMAGFWEEHSRSRRKGKEGNTKLQEVGSSTCLILTRPGRQKKSPVQHPSSSSSSPSSVRGMHDATRFSEGPRERVALGVWHGPWPGMA